MKSQPPHIARRQDGVVLVVGLLLLLVLTMTATASMRSALLNEKMTRNLSNSAVLQEAAEASLRAGEAILRSAVLPTFTGGSGFYPQAPVSDPARWTSIDWSDPLAVHPYAGFSGAPGPLATIGAAFIIEQVELATDFTPKNRGQAIKGVGTTQINDFYRITARATDASGQLSVVLETMFRLGSVDMERTAWRRLR